MSRTVVPATHPLAHIKLAAVDYAAEVCSVVTTDGRIATERLSAPPGSLGKVTRSTFIPAESRMEVIAAGETFTMILGTVRSSASVPVVYLDQNHWIDFARWRKNPTAVDAAKRPFFELMADAALDERVIIPISGAHLTETSKRLGETRMDLAATMLHFSRGWQMRTVLQLRRAELRSLFGGEPLTRDDVITLSPEAILDLPRNHERTQEFGPEIGGLIQRQVWTSVLVSLLVDDEPDDDAGRASRSQWADSFAPLANSMRSNPRARAYARDLTRTRFISDLGTDLPAAASERGVTPDDFGEWLRSEAESQFATVPGLSRLREVLHLRLSNADDKWEGNDLNDWMYLSYAAGFCDLVLGERKTINYLRRADPKVPVGAKLHRRADEAVVDLLALLGDAATD